ncbi:MAG TPA: hypothetical protein VM536_15965, partial [Chloroflexia bacterium]|nr:hypothetical protein [Chloroflexia bacterium]
MKSLLLSKNMRLAGLLLLIAGLFAAMAAPLQAAPASPAAVTPPAAPTATFVSYADQIPVRTNVGAFKDQTYSGRDAPQGRQPLPGEAQRVFIYSDTTGGAGGTPGVEYKINGVTQPRALATYQASAYQGPSNPARAEWYFDIPGQPDGTDVTYQLF